jgi:hypothetical protein
LRRADGCLTNASLRFRGHDAVGRLIELLL